MDSLVFIDGENYYSVDVLLIERVVAISKVSPETNSVTLNGNTVPLVRFNKTQASGPKLANRVLVIKDETGPLCGIYAENVLGIQYAVENDSTERSNKWISYKSTKEVEVISVDSCKSLLKK